MESFLGMRHIVSDVAVVKMLKSAERQAHNLWYSLLLNESLAYVAKSFVPEAISVQQSAVQRIDVAKCVFALRCINKTSLAQCNGMLAITVTAIEELHIDSGEVAMPDFQRLRSIPGEDPRSLTHLLVQAGLAQHLDAGMVSRFTAETLKADQLVRERVAAMAAYIPLDGPLKLHSIREV